MVKRKGTFFIAGGILFIAAAFLLTAYNLREAHQAKIISGEIVRAVEEKLEEKAQKRQKEADTDPNGELQLSQPLYELYPDMSMPVIMEDDEEYIGVLEIEALELELPVMSQWSYPGLKKAPNRYKGSVYSHDIIIAAHNYESHFGNLNELSMGDEVKFTDADGNEFIYEVADLEMLPGTAVEDMEAGDWDMTLFTCTIGGENRFTVRCVLN